MFIAVISSCFFAWAIANGTYILSSKYLLLYLIIISLVSVSHLSSYLYHKQWYCAAGCFWKESWPSFKQTCP